MSMNFLSVYSSSRLKNGYPQDGLMHPTMLIIQSESQKDISLFFFVRLLSFTLSNCSDNLD